MQTRGRALYNFIRMSWQEDKTIAAMPWQVKDYRSLSEGELYSRLSELGISLDQERFLQYAEEASTPEDLVETLWVNEDESRLDQAYLLLFELWRRLLPKRQSLSIFCDELDLLMGAFDRGELENEEKLQNAFSELENVLDEHSDRGDNPHAIFQEVSLYCALDLESFIYDYIAEQIDVQNNTYASELLDGFAPYMGEENWLTFLRVRLVAASDPDEAESMLSRLLEVLDEDPDFDLLLEISRYLVKEGATSQFVQAIQIARDLMEVEQDFQELLAITSEFYRLTDRDKECDQLAHILKNRQSKDLDGPLSESDPFVELYDDLVENFEGTEA